MKAMEPLDERDKHRLILQLLTRLKCLACGQPYELRDFTLVDRKTDMWVLNSQCRHCGNPAHVIVVMSPVEKLQSVTDLTPEESKDSAERPPISADDVLDIHAFMQEFDGDFETLFTR